MQGYVIQNLGSEGGINQHASPIAFVRHRITQDSPPVREVDCLGHPLWTWSQVPSGGIGRVSHDSSIHCSTDRCEITQTSTQANIRTSLNEMQSDAGLGPMPSPALPAFAVFESAPPGSPAGMAPSPPFGRSTHLPSTFVNGGYYCLALPRLRASNRGRFHSLSSMIL